MSNEKQTAVEWLLDRIEDVDLTEKLWENVKQQAKEMEKKQKINLPIHIHEGVENIHVYVENGVIHVKRND
jgi:hypothetical protein